MEFGKFVIGLAASVVSRVVADEVKACCPSLAEFIMNDAIMCLRAEARERYREEWASDLAHIPGNLRKIIFALDLYRAAISINGSLLGSSAGTEEVVINCANGPAKIVLKPKAAKQRGAVSDSYTHLYSDEFTTRGSFSLPDSSKSYDTKGLAEELSRMQKEVEARGGVTRRRHD